jgi:hypothetical protein
VFPLSSEDSAAIAAAVPSSTLKSVPETSKTVSETPILENLLSPDYLPSPQPERQPPLPTAPVYDPLWSPPPPPPSPESNLHESPESNQREKVAEILTDLSQSSSRSGMDTPPFYPETPLSYESFDVTRDISDWDDLSDVMSEVLDSSDDF